MDFNTYQQLSRKTAMYPNMDNNFIYPVFGLVGEAGEVAEKVKKVLRDNNGVMTPEDHSAIIKELGDVLWYVAAVATELKVNLDDIAGINLFKLEDRAARNKLSGSGDNR